jgi:hypothetical protein
MCTSRFGFMVLVMGGDSITIFLNLVFFLAYEDKMGTLTTGFNLGNIAQNIIKQENSMAASHSFFNADKSDVLVTYIKNMFLSTLKLIIKTGIVLSQKHPDGFNKTDESELAEGYVNISDTIDAMQLKQEVDQRLIDIYDQGLRTLISKLDSLEINKIATLIQTNTDDQERSLHKFLESTFSKEEELKDIYRGIFNLAKEIYQLKPAAVDPYFKRKPSDMIYTHHRVLQLDFTAASLKNR